jgi:hypothetical protein
MVEDGVWGRRQGSILSGLELVELGEKLAHLFLKSGNVGAHLLELDGVLERAGTTVGCVDAFEIEIPTAMAWCLSIAFDLSPLAFVASDRDVPISLGPRVGLTTVFSLPLLRLGRGLW